MFHLAFKVGGLHRGAALRLAGPSALQRFGQQNFNSHQTVTGNISGTLSINRATGSVTYRSNFVNYRGNSYDFVLHGKLQ